MLSVNQLDFLNYRSALKGNYRKGVYAFRTILENPAHAAGFASNLGGVSVVLGWPIGQDDQNSQQLLTLLLNSSVLDQATLTWLSQWYPDDSDDWDTLVSDLERATWMVGNALIWRAVGYSPVTAGKVIATLAGLTCAEFADIYAVVSSSTAMAAVAASETAMAAVASSSTAMQARYDAADTTEPILMASPTAIAAFTAKSTTYSRNGTWATGLNKPAFMLTMQCNDGNIVYHRSEAQCGSYKLGTARRQSNNITANTEAPMYGWVSFVEAYHADSVFTTTVRYITW